MKLFLVLLSIAVTRTVFGQLTEEEELEVASIMSDVGMLIREQENITKPPAMELSKEALVRSSMESDQRLTPEQATEILKALLEEMGIDPELERRHALTRRVYVKNKWLRKIRYAFDTVYTGFEKEIIRKGIERWEEATCLEFRELPFETVVKSGTYLKIIKSFGCWSFVGRARRCGPQYLSLADGCITPGITSHEIGHALGLFHEHLRHDRKNYIDVNMHNLRSGSESDFAKIPAKEDIDYGTGYDLSSVMHYDSLSFSNDPLARARVIVPKDIRYLGTIGQREFLSFNDAKRINIHYDCIKAKCSGIPLDRPCENGGYQDPKNCAVCRCPPGLAGDFCQEIAPWEGPVECGGVVNILPCSSAFLTSPEFPNLYAPSSSCTWKIESTGSLIFGFYSRPDLLMKPGETCVDYVEINTNMQRLDLPGLKYCVGGKTSGRVAVADDGQALVRFKSASADNFGGSLTGFKLHIYATCNGTKASQLSEECIITPTGYDYQGNNRISSGGNCMSWAGQNSFNHMMFPDNSLGGAENKCRNPNSELQPWCYVSSGYKTTGNCENLAKCPGIVNT